MSEFTVDGFAPMPSLYQDNGQVRDLSTWTDQALNDHYQTYLAFLKGETMPRAREEARRLIAHTAFELMYRSGAFDKETE